MDGSFLLPNWPRAVALKSIEWWIKVKTKTLRISTVYTTLSKWYYWEDWCETLIIIILKLWNSKIVCTHYYFLGLLCIQRKVCVRNGVIEQIVAIARLRKNDTNLCVPVISRSVAYHKSNHLSTSTSEMLMDTSPS